MAVYRERTESDTSSLKEKGRKDRVAIGKRVEEGKKKGEIHDRDHHLFSE